MAMLAFMSGERINYLSIALRARGAIKTLKAHLASQQGVLPLSNPELQQDLKSVIGSLKAIEIGDSLHAKLAHEAPYVRFEQVQTLKEASKSFKRSDLLPRLEALLAGGCKEEDMRTAIKLFLAIERRALYHCDDPSFSESGI